MLLKANKLSVNDKLQELSSDELEELNDKSQGGLKLRPYLRVLRRKAWLVALLSLMTTGAAACWSYFDSSTYSGNFYLLVEPITPFSKVTDPSTIARTGGVPEQNLFDLDYPTNLAFLQSPGMIYKLAQDIHEKLPSKTVPTIWEDLREHLTIARLGDTRNTQTKIFQVVYTGKNPQEVQKVLEVAAQTFLKYSAEDRETSLKAGVKFINDQLPALQERLKKLQIQQENLRKKYDLIDPVSKGQDAFAQVSDIQKQILDIENQLKTQKALYNVLEKQLNLTPQQGLIAASLSQDPTRSALLSKLQDIESQIALESSRFTFESPNLQNLKEERKNILNLLNQKTQQILDKNSIVLAKDSPAFNFQDPVRLKLIDQLIEANNQISLLQVRYQSLKEIKSRWDKQAKQYPEIIRQYQDLDRQINLANQILERLLTQRETLKVESSQELPWQLISPPQIPLDKDGKPVSESPARKKKLLAGLMGGLFLGGALAIWLEKRKNIFYSVDDIQDFCSVPLLGNIPFDEISKSIDLTEETEQLHQESENGKEPLANSISSIYDRGVIFLNAFDLLFTELSFIYNNPPIHSLAVSSVEAKDGHSSVAFYLAQAAVATGKRVLLVDANLRNPQLHTYLGLPNYKGLSDLLTDSELASYDVIQRSPEIDNFFFLSAGVTGSRSAKLLWFPKMQSLIREFKVRYDLIIYDAPHFYESTDIGFLGSQTDGILIVVGVAKTPQSLVKKAFDEINKLRLPILGIVANHLHP